MESRAPGDDHATPPSHLLAEAHRLLPGVIAVRRAIHRTPETGIHLPQTQKTVLRALAGLGLTVSVGEGLSSVVAVLEGAAPGRTVLLRADMDALPQQEDTGLEFASQREGVMHACGHDTHTAMLVGAARLLAARRQRLAGRVVFMFQPGEEFGGGAQLMLEEGVLGDAEEAPAVDGAFALHIAARYEAGTVHLRPGPQFAAADVLRITVRGRSGHAAAPHKVLDPVPVACEIVQALQTMMTRTVSVFDPAVLTITSVSAGSTSNVVPETAVLSGTYRTFTDTSRQVVRDGIMRVAHGVASAHGAVADVELIDGYPAVHNDPRFTAHVRRAAATVVGPARVHELPHPTMGGEDFSYVLRRVPGAMAFLGACPPDRSPATAPDNHSNHVVYEESAMAVGTAVHAAVAEAFLSGPPDAGL
ncbi:M20 metallopeptidase family protein [Streptomyces griseocarneus]|uniref:M20 metallopeptidase family protein n=1 Tax=Streptomyces griseocarneus TaxID=51201 RepID=UPI00167D3FC1|nr:M20 family metallopeptidase [Streptomyces griseocarneus]MBZ6475120.1 amidohydrolase [Streptomyces griseocarneus]GHG62150.1 hippurate hydrolase [Streptomyces griseocarneus]